MKKIILFLSVVFCFSSVYAGNISLRGISHDASQINQGTLPASVMPLSITVNSFVANNDMGNVYASTDRSLGDGADVTITFNLVVTDNNTIYSSSTGTFTVKNPGRYIINGGAKLSVNALGRRVFKLLINGTTAHEVNLEGSAVVNSSCLPPVMKSAYLNAGDTITFVVFQNSGSQLDILNGAANTFADVTRVW